MTKTIRQLSGSRGHSSSDGPSGQAAASGWRAPFRTDALVQPLSRRHLLRLMAGGTAGALSAGLWLPALAQSEGNGDGAAPTPIPGGIQVTEDVFIHFYFPGSGAEPSLITDFNGWVGVAEMSGTGVSGDGTSLGFHTDMRFMKGQYIGEDGARHHGAFAFIWLDIFTDPSDPETQIHDYNPGTSESGLFWTTAIPEASVEKGLFEASMQVNDLAIPDYFTVANSLFGGGPDPEPATVSFNVWWDIDQRPFNMMNDEQDFAGTFNESTAPAAAGIQWSAMNENSGFSYESTSSENHFALLGHERNGDLRYGRWARKHPR